jgi:hypothetical protein
MGWKAAAGLLAEWMISKWLKPLAGRHSTWTESMRARGGASYSRA